MALYLTNPVGLVVITKPEIWGRWSARGRPAEVGFVGRREADVDLEVAHLFTLTHPEKKPIVIWLLFY